MKYKQAAKQGWKEGEKVMLTTISMIAMAVAVVSIAINQILFVRHIKAIYKEVLILQQQLRQLKKQLN